jgi:hypothetical protein
MAGVSAVFLAVPFATGGGFADNAVRAAAGVDNVGQAARSRALVPRTAYLFGGAGDEIARQQIVDLAERYPWVVVNDIHPDRLRMTRELLKLDGLLPENVSFVPGNAAFFSRLNNADIYIVAPSPKYWVYGNARLGERLSNVVENVLGTNSTMFVAFDIESVAKNFRREIAKFDPLPKEALSPGTKVGPRQVPINSSYFGSRGEFDLITILR